MRLAALVQGINHVCCRYRLSAFRPFFEQAGHQLSLHPLPRYPWQWFGLVRSLRHADAVIIQRKLLHPWQLFWLRRSCRRLIFDYDDAVFLRDSYSPKGIYCERRQRAFAATIRTADAAVAGNDFLASHAAACGGRARVTVIPTCVDPTRYPVTRHHRAGAGVQMVWIGSSSTLQGLEAIRPMLEDLGKRCPGLRLKMVCDRFLSLRHLPVVVCPWSEATEASELAQADIGISWIPDDDWSRGKCGLKVLQYMAAGLPVIANPVGVHTTMIRQGVTGFLAKTQREWQEAVRDLVHNPQLRQHMGQAARQVIDSEYSVATGARAWLNLLETLQVGKAKRSA